MSGERKRISRCLLAAAMFLGGTLSIAVAADSAEPHPGEELFKARCAGCHSTEPRDHGIGPSLFGVVGRRAATVIDYEYSGAMKGFGQVWSRENLDAYLRDPQTLVPGTKSTFVGIKDAEDRRVLLDYLETKCGCSVKF